MPFMLQATSGTSGDAAWVDASRLIVRAVGGAGVATFSAGSTINVGGAGFGVFQLKTGTQIIAAGVATTGTVTIGIGAKWTAAATNSTATLQGLTLQHLPV